MSNASKPPSEESELYELFPDYRRSVFHVEHRGQSGGGYGMPPRFNPSLDPPHPLVQGGSKGCLWLVFLFALCVFLLSMIGCTVRYTVNEGEHGAKSSLQRAVEAVTDKPSAN